MSISAIVVDPEDSSHLIVGDRTAPRVYESRDRGGSWIPLLALDEDAHYRVFALALHRGRVHVSLMNRTGGLLSLFREPLSGSSYRLDPGGPVRLGGEMSRVALDLCAAGDELYAVSHLRGVFRLDGDGWEDISGSLPDVGFQSILVRADGSLCVAGGCSLDVDLVPRVGDPEQVHGVYTSPDGGETWAPLVTGDPFGSSVKRLLIHPDHPAVWFAATGRGLFVSTESGAAGSWSPRNVGLGCLGIGAMELTGDHVHVGTLGGGVQTGRIEPDFSITWRESTGPFPQIHNVQLRVDPADSRVLYATSYPGGVFRSADGGVTWQERNFGLPSFPAADPALQGYYSLEIDPGDSDVLYLGIAGKGIYRSTTGGATWRPLYGLLGQNRELMRSSITQIRVDPADSRHLYLATRDGVHHSTDAGETWAPLDDGLTTRDILSLRVVSPDAEEPFEEGFEGDVAGRWELEPGWTIEEEGPGDHVLQGAGHFWARAGNPLWSDYTLRMRLRLFRGGLHTNVRVNDDGRYFIGLHGGGIYLKKQHRGWSEFEDLAERPASIDADCWHALEIDVAASRVTVSLDGTRMLDVTDDAPLPAGAVAFETLDDSLARVDDVLVTVARGASRLYAGSAGYGVFTHDASTGRWRHLGRTLGVGWWHVWERRMYQFSSILFDEEEPGRVHLGHFPGGFFTSEDGGRSWRDSSVGLGNDGIFSLARHPHDPLVLYAGTYNGVFWSQDGGRTWESRSEGMPPEQWPYTIAIDPDDPRVLYVSTKNGQNKGFCHRNEFCGVVMKSVDGGEHWAEIMSGLDRRSEFYTLLIHPRDHDVLFLSSSRGVYWSRSRGTLWEELRDGLPTTSNQVRDNVAQNLAFTADHRYLLLGLVGHGVWRADLTRLLPR